jgi:hypothetical protein
MASKRRLRTLKISLESEVKLGLRSRLIKISLLLIVLIGIIEYAKIGLTMRDVTYTKEFIGVSPFSKGAGEVDSLPPEVLDIKNMSERNNLATFNLEFSSKYESTKILITTRTLEFLYPVRIDADSRFIFLIGDKPLLKSCKILDQLHQITLYECTN